MQNQVRAITVEDVGRICAAVGTSVGLSDWSEPEYMGTFIASFINVYRGGVSGDGEEGSGGLVFEPGVHQSEESDGCTASQAAERCVASGSFRKNVGLLSSGHGGVVDGSSLNEFDNAGYSRALPRGPNYFRNQQSRLRKKIAKEEKRKREIEQNWRQSKAEDPNVELANRVRRMKLERQEIQERRKLDKLNSPAQMIEDAMRQVALAEKYAKMANDSKVAAWAANLSSASAESIAKSAGSHGSAGFAETVRTGVTSLSNGSVKGKEKVFREKKTVEEERSISFSSCSVSVSPLNVYEKKAVLVTARGSAWIEKHRQRFGRQLTPREFMHDKELSDSITKKQLDQIVDADLN